MKRLSLVAAAACLSILAACYPVRRGEPLVGPLQTAEASVKHGEQLYNRHCYSCHTGGEGGLGPSLNDKPLPRAAMRLQIRHGLGVMPAFDRQRLSDEEVEHILDYMVALRRHGIKKDRQH